MVLTRKARFSILNAGFVQSLVRALEATLANARTCDECDSNRPEICMPCFRGKGYALEDSEKDKSRLERELAATREDYIREERLRQERTKEREAALAPRRREGAVCVCDPPSSHNNPYCNKCWPLGGKRPSDTAKADSHVAFSDPGPPPEPEACDVVMGATETRMRIPWCNTHRCNANWDMTCPIDSINELPPPDPASLD